MRSLLHLVVVVLAMFCAVGHGYCADTYFDKTYSDLGKVVSEKKTQLIAFCNALQKKAQLLPKDPVITAFFGAKRSYYRLTRTMNPTADITQQIEGLKKAVSKHYLENYLEFHDILFIDDEGEVFFTIRKESDYHKNVFAGTLSHTQLASTLKTDPDKAFVDFQYFSPSEEPAAFFIVPIKDHGTRLGWIALQCSLNKINSIFMSCELGLTGEVFLVNRDQFMLTDSRFIGDSTILRKHLNRDNIHSKFRERKGTKVVNDYRGFRAMSSFEVFPFLGSEWLIIAKIDEDEVLMQIYRDKKEELYPKIAELCRTAWRHHSRASYPIPTDSKRVDMDEFARVAKQQGMHTLGVATCTCLVASFPNNFAYMAHLSPFDRMYAPSLNHTDLLGQIMRNLTRFDLYPYQRRELRVYVAAKHMDSFQSILDYLTDVDIFPSQIRFIYNPASRYANIQYDYMKDEFLAEWIPVDADAKPVMIKGAEVLSIGDMLKQVL